MKTSIEAIFWTEKIIAIAVFFQSLELLQIRQTFTDKGIWNWNIIKKEFKIFPKPLQWILNILLKHPNFLYLIILRTVSALLLISFSNPLLIYILFFSTILICLRWRGVFNGGSDYMTIVILSALSIAAVFKNSPNANLICLWYITIQTCSSYFISGVVKIKKENWRTGKALSGFLHSTIYQTTPTVQLISNSTLCAFLASWIIIFYELSFPLSLLRPDICLVMITFAFLFHLANFYFFGLNRFLFAWCASYPALYYCSNLIN